MPETTITMADLMRPSYTHLLVPRKIIGNTPILPDPEELTFSTTPTSTASNDPATSDKISSSTAPPQTNTHATATTTTTTSAGRPGATTISGASPKQPLEVPSTSGSTVAQTTSTAGLVGSQLPSPLGSGNESGSNSSGSVAAIIGAIVGSLVVVVLVVGFVFYKQRQRRLSRGGPVDEGQSSQIDDQKDHEVKGSPPSSPRLTNSPLPSSLYLARSPQMMSLGMGDLESQTLTLVGDEELKGDHNTFMGNSNGHRSPQDHERKDQLDRMVQLHREQLQQLQELLRLHQLENSRPLAPHSLMDDGEGKEEGRPVWQNPSLSSRRGEPQGDGNTETLSGSSSRSESRTESLSERSSLRRSSGSVTVAGSEVDYDFSGKILVVDDDGRPDLMRSFVEINAHYDQQIQRIQGEL